MAVEAEEEAEAAVHSLVEEVGVRMMIRRGLKEEEEEEPAEEEEEEPAAG